ncbi:MAG: pyridoxamine 5'-phosphate oxidase family protein [Deltaproteobacteria bacterium]|nr:pyridoxamine 5'-phosphate oxidase family protein [Deltaproteobacteria bacterium]
MDYTEYFQGKKGAGVLATADGEGKVDVAVYATPHIMEDGTIAFIMADRLTHHNLQSNNHAAYLFREEGPGYKGIRLFLTKVREEKDSELIDQLRRRKYASEKGQEDASRFLVFFQVDKALPLIGVGEESD